MSDSDDGPSLGEILANNRTKSLRKARPLPATTSKNGATRPRHKSQPRELPSNRPVPVGRYACLGEGEGGNNAENARTKRSVRRFDPRFEDHCGNLRDMHVERNYGFLHEEAEERRRELQTVVKAAGASRSHNNQKEGNGDDNGDDAETAAAKRELERMKQNDIRKARVLQKRKVLQSVIDEQKDAVRKGKKPFFMKRRDLRRLELRAQFDELKRKGGVKKFIEKKRRKQAGKDKKLTPDAPMQRPSQDN